MNFKKDWGKLEELVRDYCVAEGENENNARKRLLNYLEQLEVKYKDNVNVMASHADFMPNKKKAIELYLKAYKLAEESKDYRNCTYISSSIAMKYLYNDDIVNGKHWIGCLEKDLLNFSDKFSQDELISCKKEVKLIRYIKSSSKR